MEEFKEDQIWDAIKDSAKSKIDYDSFSALFPFSADNFLSSTIYGFALNRSTEAIVDKIATQVFMTCNTVDKAALTRFIDDNSAKLKAEVALTIRALQLLNEGEDPREVYERISAALGEQA